MERLKGWLFRMGPGAKDGSGGPSTEGDIAATSARRRAPRWVFLVALLWLVALMSARVEIAAASAAAPGCEQQAPQILGGSSPRHAVQVGAKTGAAELTPVNDNSKIVDRNFGEGRTVYRRRLGFVSDRPLVVDPRQISVSIAGGLLDPKTTDVFPVDGGQVTFGAETNPSTPNTLAIKICVDPSHPQAVSPGQYAGTALIAGPGIVPAQIPITLTLKSARVWLVWLLGAVGLGLGIGVKLLADSLNPPKDEPKNPILRFVSMLVVGGVLTVGVVIKLYYEPATFGDSFSNYWPIIVGAATATAGGTTIVSLFKGT